jgi:outer membrane receptor for ferrienterochelin and colicin
MKTIEFNYYGLLTPNAITNISIFQNYANNLISRTNQMEDGVMRLFNTNSGELSTIGFEASTQYKPTNRISSTVSIVVQKSKNLQKGYENIALEYAPNFLAYATLSYQIFRNFSVGLSGHFVGAMETYWRPDTRDPLDPNDNRNPIQLIADGSRIGNRTPGYFIVNTNLRINNLFGKKFYTAVHIHNIINKEIRYPTTRSNDIFDKGTLGYGRYITLNFGMMFNE